VRELQNVVERAVILAQGGSIALELPHVPASAAPAPQMQTEVISEAEWRRREKENIVAALEKCDYRISGKNGAAELLGVNAATLTSRLKSLGIPRNKARAASFSR
jgi:DNA-binding NtrC family response regulator